MTEVSENCVNCAIGMFFNFSGHIGISKTIFSCNHANKELVRTKSAFFNVKNALSIFALLIITVANYYATKRTYAAVKDKTSLFDLLLISLDQLLYLIATIIILQGMSQNERANNMLMFFDSLLKDFNAGTSYHLLSKDDVLSFRIRTYIYLIGMFLILLGSTSIIGLFCADVGASWSSIIEKMGLLLSMYSCFMLITISLLFLRLVYCANTNYKRFLKMDLENLRNDYILPPHENQNCRIIVVLPRANVKTLLEIYTGTYIEYIKIFRTFNKTCNPILLVLILFVTLFPIISLFLIIICIENNTPITMKFLSAECFMQIIMFATGYSIVKTAKLNTQNEVELSLLQKFPLSILNNAEKLQFDCYLQIVKRYQTNFKASETISINISLFASILSTILTYVLVAVQFEFL